MLVTRLKVRFWGEYFIMFGRCCACDGWVTWAWARNGAPLKDSSLCDRCSYEDYCWISILIDYYIELMCLSYYKQNCCQLTSLSPPYYTGIQKRPLQTSTRVTSCPYQNFNFLNDFCSKAIEILASSLQGSHCRIWLLGCIRHQGMFLSCFLLKTCSHWLMSLLFRNSWLIFCPCWQCLMLMKVNEIA